MSFDGGPTDPRVVALRQDHQRRLSRFFVRFAMIEGSLLLAVAVLVYGFGVIDTEYGTALFMLVILLSAIVLGTSVFVLVRRNAREIADLGGAPSSHDAA